MLNRIVGVLAWLVLSNAIVSCGGSTDIPDAVSGAALSAQNRRVHQAPGQIGVELGATYAIATPADSPLTSTIGPFTISTFSPVTMTPFENSTNVYFFVTNTATQARTLEFMSMREIQLTKPNWLFHFFRMFGLEEGKAGVISLEFSAGETRTLEFYTSKDLGGGKPLSATLPFRFRSVADGQTGTIEVKFIGDDAVPDLLRTTSSLISGRVTDAAGAPVANALVTVGLFNENAVRSTRTNDSGIYGIRVMSTSDVATILGSRPLPYHDLSYFMTVESDGHSMAYRSAISTKTDQVSVVNITLTPRSAPPSWKLVGTLATDGRLAYWQTRFAGNGDRIVSVQGQHPPVDPGPGHIVATDLAGQELWRIVTGAQCWGFDVSADGTKIAAGCNDGYVYMMDANGTLRYRKALGERPSPFNAGELDLLHVRFSPDGHRLLVDGSAGTGGFSVIDVDTGNIVWTSSSPSGAVSQYAYQSRWSADGQRVIVGSNGLLSMYSSDGALIWRQQMGESPLWLEIDGSYNVYAAGKSRVLLAYDGEGALRWSYRLAHTSNEASTGISVAGNIMMIPTFNGMLQAFDLAGNVLWQRMLPALPAISPQGNPIEYVYGTGHNATSIAASGNLMAVGTRGWQMLVYDRTGALVWSHTASMRSDFLGKDPAAHGNYPGALSVAISPDGRYIAAGYADSVIRIFERVQK